MIVTVMYARSSSEKTGWRHENATHTTVRRGILKVVCDGGTFRYPLVNVAYWRVEQ